MKTITLVAYNRPEYTQEVLESLSEANPVGYRLIISLDPGDSATEKLLREFTRKTRIKTTLVKNGTLLGVNYNNLSAFKIAFEMGSKFNVAIEDDTPISPDTFELADWFMDNASNYFVLNLFSFGTIAQEPLSLMECKDFCPWGWCFSKKSFEDYIVPNWMSDERGWDWSINKTMKAYNLKSLRPVLSRSRNIGRDLGTHCTPELYDHDFPSSLKMSEGKHGNSFSIIPKDWAELLLEEQHGHRLKGFLC